MENVNTVKIIERVRKLLALSQSSNEHEAALAAEKANAILAEYNLSMDEISQPKESVTSDNGLETKNWAWARLINHWTAKLYFCGYFYTQYSKKTAHTFIGEPHNVAVAKMMSEYLVNTVFRLSVEAASVYLGKERGTFRRSFRNAAAQRLAVRIRYLIEERKRSGAITQEGRNLPALMDMYKKAEQGVAAFLQQRGTVVKTSRGKMRSSHHEGYAAGRQAGDSISLNRQVGGASSVKKLTHAPS